MYKTLVLAEKPSVGREIARVLKCNKIGNGYLEGDKYIVTWALGHLVTLGDPEVYDKSYATWKMEDLPLLPDPFELVVIKQTGKQYSAVKGQLLRKDVNEIVIATDAGREGELVGRWIIEKVGTKKPIKRLWISSITDRAIKDGFSNLRDGKDYEKLYASAVARAEADWIVGINATRALTSKYNTPLSCGRVQTPTLTIIAKREEEIKNFKPKTFYGITAITNDLRLIWQDNQTKDTKIFDKELADKALASLHSKNAEIIDVNKAYKKSYSPKLYDLTELQRDANRLYDFSAKETLTIMQKLYEGYKILTYPRTDSRYLTSDIVGTLKDRIKACGIGPYSELAQKLLRNPIKADSSFVDNSKVSDHHAIIPTEQTVPLSSLSNKERKIYDLVVKRFFAVLHPPFEYEQTTITAKIDKELFVAKGKIVINQGWKKIYYDEYNEVDLDIAEQILPILNKGDTLNISKVMQTSGETKPPKPLNEGTLLSAMENPAKYMAEESKELIKIIGETHGIGTVATRADIIEKLSNSYLIEKRGKEIYITSKGKQLLELVPTDLKSPALTAKWEMRLDSIAKGKHSKNSFLNDMKFYTKTIVKEIKESKEVFKYDNITRKKCPNCDKYLLEVNGKNGKILVCQDRECGYKKTIARLTNSRCPNCHKKLDLVGEGEAQTFVCSCGHREKLSAFKKRKENEKAKASKKDVNKFLKDQNKINDEPFNSALADALAKLKRI
ncbi:DNA topoisomerase III [Tepidibacillus marianensis]|uniref:DNA topoisomerase III n=1 Tax=Tepidibacillus marianensis TaxID=3131995 RepID=UPI0030CAB1C9